MLSMKYIVEKFSLKRRYINERQTRFDCDKECCNVTEEVSYRVAPNIIITLLYFIVCLIFRKGREGTFPCSQRSTCSLEKKVLPSNDT